ncbi:hypothetical protein ACFE04_006954 [Oxalis oulophora]
MAEEEEEREVEVRTLSGEVTTVKISANKTVNEVKQLLKLNFTPASSSPNFHLFFKGVKLGLQSRISLHTIHPGDFLVLIPYTKKERSHSQTQNSQSFKNQTTLSSFSDSTYNDMMRDLSSFCEESSNTDKVSESRTNFAPNGFCFGDKNNAMASSETKRKRDVDDNEGQCYDFLCDVIRSTNKNVIDEKNCDKFVGILESVNCLSDPQSGRCLWLRGINMVRGVMDDEGPCSCPVWLKRITKAFVFLSIFSAFARLRNGKVFVTELKETMNKLERFGVKVSIEDIEHLSVLCPKVVSFVDSYVESSSFGNAIFIIKSSKEDDEQKVGDNRVSGQEGKLLLKVYGEIKKWESSLKTNVWQAVKSLVARNGKMLLSLEDLLMYMKDGGSKACGNEVKRARKKDSFASRPHSHSARCHETKQLLPVEMVEHLKIGIGSYGQVVHVENISTRRPIHVEVPNEYSDNTKYALKRMGITKLYSHQEESIRASLAGKNVVVATMTSSGKSLCYNVPVLEALSQNLLSCALYLFPTKALAQDQLRALKIMTSAYDASIEIGIYDGDTLQKDRMWLRENARLLITNPDMLHLSILPYHGQFSRILSNLRFVVIDEAHAYKGAFGCHTSLILRRLRRLCSHVYGSDPAFVFSTATSANPAEHCMELANLSTLELITNDGSPSSQKLFVLWNPSVATRTVLSDEGESNKDNARKSASTISEISCLFAEMVQHGLRCIAFCGSRKLCELVLCYTREILEETAPHMVNSICAYRAGYTAEDRRKIEKDFFNGELCGIAATSALELGIDVGHIDVTLHLGFPGSIASLWQQAGRSGRREKPSLAIYVAFEAPLDQYFMKYPEKLFRSPIECNHIHAENPLVLEQHLVCAALEHPLSLIYDERYFGSGLDRAVTCLKNKGYLSCDPSRDSSARMWSYIGREKKPSQNISIRAIESEKYKVIDTRRNEVIEEIEESKAFFQVYDGAVYMNQGKTYLVTELNISSKFAFCREANVDYYTRIRDYTDIHVNGGNLAYAAKISKNKHSRTTAQSNSCKVTTTWFGFRMIKKRSNRVFDTIDLSLPNYSYESQAVWIDVSQTIKTAVEKICSFRSGLHAACHALLHVVPLYVRCNYSDLAPECPNPHETRYYPARILLYDKHPGGAGVSIQIQPYFTELLTAAMELLMSCKCSAENGCPNCVQNLACGEYNELLHKDAALRIIKVPLLQKRNIFLQASLILVKLRERTVPDLPGDEHGRLRSY